MDLCGVFCGDDSFARSLLRERPEWEARPTVALGDTAVTSREAGAEVLTRAVQKVKDARLTPVIGPVAGDTWHNYRCVSESDGSRRS